MKKNSSQWSMSNPAGNAVCYRYQSVHHPWWQPTAQDSPVKGGCGLAVTWGPVTDALILLDRNGSMKHRAEQAPAVKWCSFPSSPAPLLVRHLMGLAFWISFFPLDDFELLFLHLRIEASFKAYWSNNGISHLCSHHLILVLSISNSDPLATPSHAWKLLSAWFSAGPAWFLQRLRGLQDMKELSSGHQRLAVGPIPLLWVLMAAFPESGLS